MQTLYRIIDEDTLEVLVEDIPREQIWEYSEQFMDSGHTRLRSEQYQKSGIRPGLGRDPDLH